MLHVLREIWGFVVRFFFFLVEIRGEEKTDLSRDDHAAQMYRRSPTLPSFMLASHPGVLALHSD